MEEEGARRTRRRAPSASCPTTATSTPCTMHSRKSWRGSRSRAGKSARRGNCLSHFLFVLNIKSVFLFSKRGEGEGAEPERSVDRRAGEGCGLPGPLLQSRHRLQLSLHEAAQKGREILYSFALSVECGSCQYRCFLNSCYSSFVCRFLLLRLLLLHLLL